MNSPSPFRKSAPWIVAGAVALGLAVGLLPETDATAATAASGEVKVVATVAGSPITQDELERAAAQQLAELEKRRLQTLNAALEGLIADRVVELEAEARGITREQLLDQEVKAKVPAVTDADVDAFYTERASQLRGRPKEQVAPQIRNYLGQQRTAERYQELLRELNAKYRVENFVRAEIAAAEAKAAQALRTSLETGDAPAKGPADAPVTIVEFSDFECPFCSRVLPALKQVEEEYGDQVRVVFRQFPLNSIHPRAQKAAEASLCAHEQGKFWQMHDLMFSDQKNLEIDALKAKAASLELDTERFDACLDSGQYADEVRADLAAGEQVGVSGTPAMFINGRLLSGAAPFEQIAAVIDEALERAGKDRSTGGK